MSAEEQQDLLDAAEEQSASLGTLQDRAGNQIEKILAAALSSTLPGILQAYRRYTSSLRPTDQPIDGAGTIYTPTGTGAQAEARRRALRAEIDRFSRQVDPAAIEDVARSVLDEAVDLGEQAAARFGAMQGLPMPPVARPTQDIRTLASSITGRITSEADGFRSIMSQIISDSAVQGFPGRRVERVVIEAFQGDQLPDGTIKTRGMVQRAIFNIETEVSVVSLEHQMETIRKAGHRYVRWVTAQDEKVCGFCASRHGKVYLSDQIRIPAHSRCRCMAVPVKPEDIGPDAQDAEFWKEEQDATIAAYAKAHNLTPEEAARKLQEYGRKPTQFEKYAQPVDPKPVQAVWEPGRGSVGIGATGKPEWQIKGEEAIASGEDFFRKYGAGMTGGKAVYDRYNRVLHSLIEKRKELIAQASDTSIPLKQRNAERRKLEDHMTSMYQRAQKGHAAMVEGAGKMRNAMLRQGISKADADRFVTRSQFLTLLDDAGTPKGRKSLESDVIEWTRMFKGSAFKPGDNAPMVTMIIEKAGIRGSNIVAQGWVEIPTGDRRKAVLFHELAHTDEMQGGWTAPWSRNWAREKAWSPGDSRIDPSWSKVDDYMGKPRFLLDSLQPGNYTGSDEKAFADDYLTPYMGKLYEHNDGTEVWSMAHEMFADPRSMATLWAKHPDLFYAVIGRTRLRP